MSIYDNLLEYSKSDYYAFHMPGHKRQPVDGLPSNIDITEIEGFDDLHEPEGIILEEQHRIARLYKAKASFILVNGSTVGNLVGVYGFLKSSDTCLIDRGSHRSVYNAVKVTGCDVQYISTISVDKIREQLSDNPRICLVVLTSPSYEGAVLNIEEIARVCHEYDVALMVDCAHGAHFGFHEIFPKSPVELGADIVVMSLHKTLPALTQTAVLHICSDRIDIDRIKEAIDIFETSSPSYVLMASVSKAMDIIEKEDAFFEYVNQLKAFYEDNKDLKHLQLWQDTYDKKDIGKVVISCKKTEITGPKLLNILNETYHLQMEMAASDYVIAMTSMYDTNEGFSRLTKALHDIDSSLKGVDIIECDLEIVSDIEAIHYKDHIVNDIFPVQRLKAKEVKDYDWESVSINMACGRICAKAVLIYPPGSPVIVEGEVYDDNLINTIMKASDLGLHVPGLSDTKEVVVIR